VDRFIVRIYEGLHTLRSIHTIGSSHRVANQPVITRELAADYAIQNLTKGKYGTYPVIEDTHKDKVA